MQGKDKDVRARAGALRKSAEAESAAASCPIRSYHQAELLTDRETAKFLGISRPSVWRWSRSGRLPPPIHIGASARWVRTELVEALDRFRAERNAKLRSRPRPMIRTGGGSSYPARPRSGGWTVRWTMTPACKGIPRVGGTYHLSWVRDALEDELEAYAVAIEDELVRRTGGSRHELRRRFLALWRRLPERDRIDFLTRITGGAG